MTKRIRSFAQAVNEAISQSMELDKRVLCLGLGVTDPKGVFGTTLGLQEKFGQERVFDIPTSENAVMGVCVGAALGGLRPIYTHQRLDFFLLAMDQLVNNAAKWHYMFGSRRSVPVTIRLILGRGWGQGPTHSQTLQSWFAHIPGLKVVMPALPGDAKSLLLGAIADDNPVLFLEHRWLHQTEGEVSSEYIADPLGQAKRLLEGDDITLVSSSYMTIEALNACRFLNARGIGTDLIDLRSVSPLDRELIFASVAKTQRLLVLDTSHGFCSVASEIVATVCREIFMELKAPPDILALPDFPVPTSIALTKDFYPTSASIVEKVSLMLEKNLDIAPLREIRRSPHDVPDDSFRGPF